MSSSNVILITGGTGFAGSHLVDCLLESGENQVHVTSYGTNSGHVSQVLPAKHLHQLDLTQFEPTKLLLGKIRPTQIYHLAALAGVGSSFDNLKHVLDANTQIQLSLLTAVKEVCPNARILSIGSALEYQPSELPLNETDVLGPVSPYGVSKVTQDMLAYSFYRQNNLNIVRTRPFNHFGERQTSGFVVADFALQVAKIMTVKQAEQIITVGNLEAKRDFSYVRDITQAYIHLMKKGETGEVYNLGSGKSVSVRDILDKLISLSRMKIEVKVDQQKFRPIDVPIVLADIGKIKKLGWSPSTPLDTALKVTLDYYKYNYQLFAKKT